MTSAVVLVFVCPPPAPALPRNPYLNSYVEILMPDVTVLEGRAFWSFLSYEGRDLTNEISIL